MACIQGHAGSLNLLIEDKVARAYPGGTGGIKNISNYSPVCIYDRLDTLISLKLSTYIYHTTTSNNILLVTCNLSQYIFPSYILY